MKSQAAFVKAQQLNFALLSDPDGSVAGKYDVLWKGRSFSRRVTFVIDDKGVLRHVDRKVNVSNHGTDLVAVVQKLQR